MSIGKNRRRWVVADEFLTPEEKAKAWKVLKGGKDKYDKRDKEETLEEAWLEEQEEF